ncbi:MAG: zf-HC2 domain-containing protein [Propionicimonas sp.]|uniref:zf-HC2 domain-containing protein n=1 Tax=Propionicimonas sp. TaxID=1955623 RepID=UPI002B215A64|nr:zf-HC2 domain-containing protein [Propionicimonas sp.]MEA4944670.1 zf-HC2 domain-containing protein [Propionicimonas sp.]MEA5117855.1 zf-HC2 domain-containing protein [Propionicimonas sp.]
MELDELAEQTWRAALSAMLDGEEPDLPVASIAAHLTSCADCSAWLDQAAALNRGLRTLPVLEPDLGERLVNGVDVQLCGCRTGGECLCGDCQCGPHCSCHAG